MTNATKIEEFFSEKVLEKLQESKNQEQLSFFTEWAEGALIEQPKDVSKEAIKNKGRLDFNLLEILYPEINRALSKALIFENELLTPEFREHLLRSLENELEIENREVSMRLLIRYFPYYGKSIKRFFKAHYEKKLLTETRI